MTISFERSGGFAGLTLRTVVDTDALPPDEAERLRKLVARAGFFDLPGALPGGEGADRFQYVVTAEDGERRHTVRTGEAEAPDALRELLDELTRLARSKRAGPGA